MYNIINLKFTVIASCGANIVILSSKQYLIHRRLKTTTRGAWFWKKKKNKTTRKPQKKAPQKYKMFSVSCSAFLKGSHLNQLMASSQRPTVRGFALFGCHTLAVSLCRNGGLKHWQKEQNNNRIEPRANLFSELTVRGAKQNCCDGRVTLYSLTDQMARITDLCKPRAFSTIWRLFGEI